MLGLGYGIGVVFGTGVPPGGAPVGGDKYLLETGDDILLETGDFMLLE